MSDVLILTIASVLSIVMLMVLVIAAVAAYAYREGTWPFSPWDDPALPAPALPAPALPAFGEALGSFVGQGNKTMPWNILWNQGGTASNVTNDDGGSSMRVVYKAGVRGSESGHSFRANPLGQLPAEAATLSYDVYFPEDFVWGNTSEGGKLPGFGIGTSQTDRDHVYATGCKWKDDAGSVRVMWREGGKAVVYVYVPTQATGGNVGGDVIGRQGAEYRRVAHSTGGCGNDLWRHVDTMTFQKGSWNSVRVHIRLNTVGHANGVLALTVNGKVREVRDITFRTDPSVKITVVHFSTFFGGGDSYAPTKDVWAKFSNFKFSAP
jgi:hypothetical protein